MSAAPPKTGTISGTGQVILPPAAGSRVSSYKIQFEASTSPAWNGSVTIQEMVGNGMSRIAIGYKDDETQAVATSAITGNRVVLVDSSGGTIVLDCTSYTAGSLEYYAVPLVG